MLFDACGVAELPPGARLCRVIGGEHLLLLNTGREIFACALNCTHESISLEDGALVDGTIECPLHGAVFNLRDGTVEFGPAEEPLPVFPVVVLDGMVKVDMPVWA